MAHSSATPLAMAAWLFYIQKLKSSISWVGRTTPLAAVARPTVFFFHGVRAARYTPDYFVPEGTQPELLALASLKWGHGLPPGMQVRAWRALACACVYVRLWLCRTEQRRAVARTRIYGFYEPRHRPLH